VPARGNRHAREGPVPRLSRPAADVIPRIPASPLPGHPAAAMTGARDRHAKTGGPAGSADL